MTGTDSKKAVHTAIVSDLHLCEEEPVNAKYPLWKKYKTRQFFFDEEFAQFIEKLTEMSNGKKIELVLNGDIFDFDSCTSLPNNPTFYISWLERKRGLHPQEEKSVYKINVILKDHAKWVESLAQFARQGNDIIFVIGNHDLELHFPKVQETICHALTGRCELPSNIRFVEWFYISNGDTHIEHGNQYDPYCMAQDPIRPFIQNFNRIEVRVPFGNLATRYLINGMGFFNPHLDANYIMTPKEYMQFFFKYIVRAQPFLILTWLWGSVVTLIQSFFDRLRPNITDPLGIEDKIEKIAQKANATPRMVRELKELFVAPAASHPLVIMKELWLDRAFLMLATFAVLYVLFLQVDRIFNISMWWMFVPFFLFIPFFLFYSRSVYSTVHEFKEPRDDILSLTSTITKVFRVVYGHTHIVRHEMIGAVEHLNCGTWSPAFSDVECEKPIGRNTFVWIAPGADHYREAKVLQIKNGNVYEVFATSSSRIDRQNADAKLRVDA